MKKNGFTLIELLAVIVILAIIALIATPIILGIINDSREKSDERSVELYASAVKNAVMAYRLTNSKAAKNFEDLTIEYDGDVVCSMQELFQNGSFYLDGCRVNGGEKEYSFGKDLNPPVCTIAKQDSSKYSVGDIITCELSESTDKFYVIEEQPLTSRTIKVLTEKNIDIEEFRQSDTASSDGVFSDENYWFTYDDNWNRVLLPQYGTTYPANVYNENANYLYPSVEGYVSYLNENWSQDATGSLLTYEQIINLGCVDYNCSGAPSWVYSTTYWTGSARDYYYVWLVTSEGQFYDGGHNGLDSGFAGVRPVITMSTTELKK